MRDGGGGGENDRKGGERLKERGGESRESTPWTIYEYQLKATQ